jgi:hypothetical protein
MQAGFAWIIPFYHTGGPSLTGQLVNYLLEINTGLECNEPNRRTDSRQPPTSPLPFRAAYFLYFVFIQIDGDVDL